MADKAKETIRTPRPEYQEMFDDWQLCRDLMKGTRAMWDSGSTWLPQWTMEGNPDYDRRLHSTILFNGFARAVKTLSGKVFSEPVTISEDYSQTMYDWFDNIDLTGRPLNTFAATLFRDGLQSGLSHILIDKPRVVVQNRLQEIQQGVRPYWVHIPAENVIWWHSEQINGKEQLLEVRILEFETTPEGFGLTTRERVKVLRPGEWEIWERITGPQGETWAIVDAGLTGLDEIPLVTVYFERSGFMTARPPLLDLAFLNLSHWRSQSVQTHVLELGRRPIPYFHGYDPTKLQRVPVGPFSALINTAKDAEVGFAEITGASIGAGRENLIDLKDEMAAMSVELLIRKPGEKTATQANLQADESNSELGQMAVSCAEALTQASLITERWGGLPDSTGRISISTDFELTSSEQAEMDQLLKMRQAGEITRRTFLIECQRRDLFGDEFNVDDEIDSLDQSDAEDMAGLLSSMTPNPTGGPGAPTNSGGTTS